jgi:hypothetical protein
MPKIKFENEVFDFPDDATEGEIKNFINKKYPNKNNSLAQTPEQLNDYQAGLFNVAQGATFNFADEALAGVDQLGQALTGGDRTYQESKKRYNDQLQDYNTKNPWKALGANIVGGIGTGIATAPLALGNLIGGAGKLATAGRTALNLTDDAAQGALSAYGDDADEAKGALDSALFGGVVRGGIGGASAVSKAIAKKFGGASTDAVNKGYVNDVRSDFSEPDNTKVALKTLSREADKILVQPELMSDDFLEKARSNIRDLKGINFPTNLNDVTEGAFSTQANMVGENSLMKQESQAERLARVDSLQGGLDRIASFGNGKDLNLLGQELGGQFEKYRKTVDDEVNNVASPFYQKALYNPVENAMQTQQIGERVAKTDFNEIDLNDYVGKPIEPTVNRPEFSQRMKYPMMSFLQGKVKRSGRFSRQLEAMDITPKSHPRLFGKDGQDSLDNIDASNFPEFTQAGYKPDDAGYMSESDILDSINNELMGNPIKLNPENMRQSEISRLKNTEQKQREYDSYGNMYDDGVKIDQFGNELPKTKAYSAEDIFEPINETKLNPALVFKTIDDANLKTDKGVRSAIQEAINERMRDRIKGRPQEIRGDKNNLTDQDFNLAPENSLENILTAKKITGDKLRNAYKTDNKTYDQRELQGVQTVLSDILNKNEDYVIGNKLIRDNYEFKEKQNLDKFGKIVDQIDNPNAGRIVKELFSDGTSIRQFNNIINELNLGDADLTKINAKGVLGALVSDALGKTNKDSRNVDTTYNYLFNNDNKKEKIAILLGGKDTPDYKEFETVMKATGLIKSDKFMKAGSTTANKQDIMDVGKATVQNTKSLLSEIKNGKEGAFNVLFKAITSFMPDNAIPNTRQSQEMIYSFFVNPRNTEKSLKFIEDLKKAKDKRAVIDSFYRNNKMLNYGKNATAKGTTQGLVNQNRDRNEEYRKKLNRENLIRARGL